MAYLTWMRPEELLAPTPSGIFCQPGGFCIDPTRPPREADRLETLEKMLSKDNSGGGGAPRGHAKVGESGGS